MENKDNKPKLHTTGKHSYRDNPRVVAAINAMMEMGLKYESLMHEMNRLTCLIRCAAAHQIGSFELLASTRSEDETIVLHNGRCVPFNKEVAQLTRNLAENIRIMEVLKKNCEREKNITRRTLKEELRLDTRFNWNVNPEYGVVEMRQG